MTSLATDSRAAFYYGDESGERDRGTGRFKPKGAPDTPRRKGMGDIPMEEFVTGVDSGALYIDPATGRFTPERQALHDQIVNDALAGHRYGGDDGVPRFMLLGGGPAAGKSTLLKSGVLLPDADSVLVANDDIKVLLPEGAAGQAAGTPNWAPFVHKEAGYIADRIQNAAMERGYDVILDGTGNSTPEKVIGQVDQAKRSGYKVLAHYVTVPTDLAAARALERQKATGRGLPESVLRAKHAAVSRCAPLVADRVEHFTLHDTSVGSPATLVAERREGSRLQVYDQALWDAFLAKGMEGIPPKPGFAVADQAVPSADDIIRMYVEIVMGGDRRSSLVSMTPAAAAMWDRLEQEIAAMGSGVQYLVPAEWPPPGMNPLPPDVPPAIVAAAGEPRTSGMIALYPDAPETLAVAGGELPEDLHLTLMYLGPDVTTFPPETLLAIQTAIEAAAAAVAGPFTAKVAGAGVLGDEGAIVLNLEAPEIQEVHDSIVAVLREVPGLAEQYPSFIPHLTLGYPADEDAYEPLLLAAIAEVGGEITFSNIGLALAEELSLAPLGGDPSSVEPVQTSTVPGATWSITVDQATPGTRVMWSDPDGTLHTGEVTGDAPSDDGTVEVTPDEGDGAVTLALDDLSVEDNDDPSEEFSRRRDVTRYDIGAPTAVSGTDGEMRWQGPLVVEGVPSGDNRSIAEGALTWRDLPLPLMVMFRNADGGDGHAGAELAGRIDELFRPEDRPNEVWGRGVYDDSPVGREAYRLLNKKMLRGVSVDLSNMKGDYTGAEPDETGRVDVFGGQLLVTGAKIMGATQCAFPAFAEAYLEVLEPEALAAAGGAQVEARFHSLYDGTQIGLVASAGPALYPVRPPAAWFAMPVLDGPTPVRVTPQGQVYGHVATWGECHIGFAGRCITVPRSSCSYAEFRKGQVLCADGELIATGPLVTDTVHPSLAKEASDAQAFYHDTGCVAADLAVYEDKWGVVVAGAMRSTATDEQTRAVRGGDVSPDWRPIRGRLETVAMLVVNNSGFKVPLSLVAAAGGAALVPGSGPRAAIDFKTGEVTALVAAGRLVRTHADARVAELDDQVAQLSAAVARLQAQVRPLHAARVAARADALVAGR